MSEAEAPKKKRKTRRSLLIPDPDTVYLRCSACGHRFDEKMMRHIENKLLCGVCFLLKFAVKK